MCLCFFSGLGPEQLSNSSQNLVRKYEILLVSLDLFELNLVKNSKDREKEKREFVSFQRMLQDYSSTQADFRRIVSASLNDPRRLGQSSGSMDQNVHPNQQTISGRGVDVNQFQLVLNKIQSQIDSINSLKEIGKKYLESSTNSVSTR